MSWPDRLHRPYPEATYDGAAGEASAWLRSGDRPPDVTYPSGVTCEYLATGDRTRGRFGLYRWTFGEGESGPDPHFHRTISEQFYVLSGQVRLFDGRGWVTAGAGDFLYVPEGGVHGFRGADGAQMLLMFAPGGPREDYFETLARGGPEAHERAAFMERHDTWWV
ncbi:cupin domain-containing protein [Ornithinimicrobium cerasi]|uniref:Mannose-6-phosphate isomerase, cupin superfamily n=1 Tax=Ornithinimicrobium cerasi TaxID=2248773 RepID=A0A285VVB6_9MICO|nr:cupin domain-containing protein [Ornithinimicrobium cerasi]SOC56581.1 Mannose-6-phosphate isomerase, cupin superfamily [Ornithinimicrobium cerasi]